MDAEIKNALITGTSLGMGDAPCFTFYLYLDYGGSGQGAGGYCLDSYDQTTGKRKGWNVGIDFISRVLEIVGVDRWEDLKGEHIRVRATHSKVLAIGNLLKDDWLIFAEWVEEHRDN